MIQDLQAANAAEQVTVTYTISTNQSSITGTRGLSLMVQRLRLHTPNEAELRSHRLHRAARKKKKPGPSAHCYQERVVSHVW